MTVGLYSSGVCFRIALVGLRAILLYGIAPELPTLPELRRCHSISYSAILRLPITEIKRVRSTTQKLAGMDMRLAYTKGYLLVEPDEIGLRCYTGQQSYFTLAQPYFADMVTVVQYLIEEDNAKTKQR